MKILKILIASAENPSGAVAAALQHRFAHACNFVADIAVGNACFSRVRLHHIAYRVTRERYPDLGSQLVSNAIYAVCRKAKSIEAKSREGLKFGELSPVYFDRHTLSVRRNVISMFTLDGRMKFQASLTPQFLKLFKEGPLKEVQLTREQDNYYLLFYFRQTNASKAVNGELEQAA